MESPKITINRQSFLAYWTFAGIVFWLLTALGAVVLGVGILIGLAFALVWTPRLKESAVKALGVELLDVQDKIRTSIVMATVFVIFAPLLGMLLDAIPAFKSFTEEKPFFFIFLSCFVVYKAVMAIYEWQLVSALNVSRRAWFVSNVIGLLIYGAYVFYYSSLVLAPYAHQTDALILSPIFLLLRPELAIAIVFSSLVNAITIATSIQTENLVVGDYRQRGHAPTS